MSDELDRAATSALVPPFAVTGIGVICACGAGWHSVQPSAMPELQRELQIHIAERHPKALGVSLTLSAYPVEPAKPR